VVQRVLWHSSRDAPGTRVQAACAVLSRIRKFTDKKEVTS